MMRFDLSHQVHVLTYRFPDSLLGTAIITPKLLAIAWLGVSLGYLTALDGVAAEPSVSVESSHSMPASAAALAIRQGYQFRAVAHEPMVVDPVSVRLDWRGRLWVVEMPDYPNGPADGSAPSGRIKILEDRDGDGVFDHVDLFADGLDFATGVQPYRDGAIVTAAGQILFLRDRDGDNRVDETTVLFQGFAAQNQQLRANHPTLGPDGMIYVANGLRGGLIVAVDARFESRPQPLDLRDRDFVFDPEGGHWGAVTGHSQFGLTIDDFGRRIGCSNRNPAMTALLSLQAIDRDPLLAARDAVLDVATAAERSVVVSRAEAWTTSNLHAGQFSAACGVLAPGIEGSLGEWMLVCEPTAYVVQRQWIKRRNSAWEAVREVGNEEFFASSDTWFRPVDLTAGPSSSVFVVDMARAVIEHPDFMPTELQTRPDQREGTHLGRIWQLSSSGNWPSPVSLESTDQAIQWLASESAWQRQMASQFLLESPDDHRPKLRKVVASESALPQGRARAAWWLHRRHSLDEQSFRALLRASDGRLRGLAAELALERPEWLDEILRLSGDADALVRRVSAAVVASGSDRVDQRAGALVAALLADVDDAWIARTVASADSALVASVAAQLIEQGALRPGVLSHLVQRLAMDAPDQAAVIVSDVISKRPSSATLDVVTIEILEAWLAGNRRGRRSAKDSLDSLSPSTGEQFKGVFDTAAQTVVDVSVDPSLRARCVSLAIAVGRLPENLRGLFAEDSPPEVRITVLEPLLHHDTDWMRQYLEEHLTAMSIRLRAAALSACGNRPSDAIWLLDRIADGVFSKTVIDPEMAKRLRQHPNAEVSSRAEALLRADPDRARVLAGYSVAAENLGDPLVGKRLFAEHCSACHQIDGVGTNVGPDISDTRTKTAEALLISILDPNAAIDSSFVQFQVLTVDGRILDGLLIDETADAVTLQQRGGQRTTVAREEIERMQAPGVSLMPEGFERTLDLPAMADLLSYLKNWRYLKTSIPVTLPVSR